MKNKDLLKQVMNFERTDRIPWYDVVRNDAIIKYFARQEINDNDYEESLECLYTATDCFIDISRISPYPPRQRGEYVNKDGFVCVNDRWTSWVKERPFHDSQGAAGYIRKKLAEPLPSEQDMKRSSDAHSDLMRNTQDRLRTTFIVWKLPSIGIEMANSIFGMEIFAYLCHDQPELISAWFERNTQTAVMSARHLDCEVCFAGLLGDDLADKNGPIFSPAFLEKEFFPRLARVVDAIHSQSIKIAYHSDGNLMPVMDSLVACGIDGLHPVDTICGMQLSTVRDKYPHLFLIGGIDCCQLLPFGSVEEVKKRVKEAISETEGLGYIVGSTSELGNAIPVDNILAVREALEEEY